MESGGIGGFAPNWVAAPLKAQAYQVLDTPNERQNKMAINAPEIPKADFKPVIPPAEGPVTYAERLGRESRQGMDEQIAANMRAAHQRVATHYGKLHAVA
jgi:hypothetical protein